MSKKLIIGILGILSLLFPITTYAHGGVEKSVGNTVVEILQDPISPLVGEKVTVFFTFKDKSVVSSDVSKQELAHLRVTLTVTDTYTGDESKDKVIHTEHLTTDVNGNASFTYTFRKENYFDIDLTFKDKQGKEQEIGFLIQPRSALPFPMVIGSLIFVFLLGIVASMLYRVKDINGLHMQKLKHLVDDHPRPKNRHKKSH